MVSKLGKKCSVIFNVVGVLFVDKVPGLGPGDVKDDYIQVDCNVPRCPPHLVIQFLAETSNQAATRVALRHHRARCKL